MKEKIRKGSFLPMIPNKTTINNILKHTHAAAVPVLRFLAPWACALCLALLPPARALALSEVELRLETHRAMPVQSNETADWPTGPVVGAESAILIEAQTGTILYAKNIHQAQYPASTTKILTALIASEMCQMDEIVNFSQKAVFDTPRDSTHIAMDTGQALTMGQCMEALLIRSANEVAYAMAEHITGSTDWQVFADIMNERAAALGCVDSHFANPNGLPDENHYTSAYDMAMIGRAFFANEMLCKITVTPRFEFPATDRLPQTKIENNKMKLLPGAQYAYEYLVGCKTGYTDTARSSLVACAERNGLKLISVVLHDEAPCQYEDTIALFEYGFANFEKVNVAQTETRYRIEDTGLFYSGNDIFGSSQPLLSLDKDDFIILPRTVAFQDLESSVSYQTQNENQAALISYTCSGVPIGSVGVNFASAKNGAVLFDTPEDKAPEDEESGPLFINVKLVLILLGIAGAAAVIVFLVRLVLRNYSFAGRRHRPRRRRTPRRRYRRTKWLDD